MAAVRTQVYLTAEQRARLGALMEREHKGLAEIIREAIDAYLATTAPDVDEALNATFGTIPDLIVPSRDEWNRERRSD